MGGHVLGYSLALLTEPFSRRQRREGARDTHLHHSVPSPLSMEYFVAAFVVVVLLALVAIVRLI